MLILKIKKNLSAFLLICFSLMATQVRSQHIENTYFGTWAKTTWQYTFKADGTYKKSTRGHFGSTVKNGNYHLHHDTLILCDSGKTKASEIFLFRDSIIVDIESFYDYHLKSDLWFYNSKQRLDMVENVNWDSMVRISKVEFDSLITKHTKTLKNVKVSDMNPDDRACIVRLYNTCQMYSDSLNGETYSYFLKTCYETEFQYQVLKTSKHIYSRGMGYYLCQLKLEIGGTPHIFSLYTITN